MIEVNGLTRRYGARTAVDRLSFLVQPGKVTGFLGPNGAGKTTTLRLILGLDRPDAGTATIGGIPLRSRPRGLRHVGALLDAQQVHGGYTALAHLSALARGNGLPRARADEMLSAVGLAEAAHRRISGYSLGMKQRLGIATALLGDPPVLILDEPINGMDPEGVLWLRHLLRRLAAEGRTVFLSSHLMAEMANTADELIVIGQGRLLAQRPVHGLGQVGVTIRTDQVAELIALLTAAGARAERDAAAGPDYLNATGLSAQRIARIAADHQILLYQLVTRTASLEEAFMQLTADSAEYRAGRAG